MTVRFRKLTTQTLCEKNLDKGKAKHKCSSKIKRAWIPKKQTNKTVFIELTEDFFHYTLI